MPRHEALITIARFSTALDASVARGALETCGIEAFVPGEALGTFSRNLGGVATTELQVFASDRERAIVELRRMQIRIVERPSVDVD